MKQGADKQKVFEEIFRNGDDPVGDSGDRTKELEKCISQVRSDMAHMISHKFRTPLSILLTSAELLEYYSKSLDEEKKLEHLCRIRAAVLDLTQMLDQILTRYGQPVGVRRNEENPDH